MVDICIGRMKWTVQQRRFLAGNNNSTLDYVHIRTYSYILKHTYLLYISIANNNDDKLYRYCGYHLSVQKLILPLDS